MRNKAIICILLLFTGGLFGQGYNISGELVDENSSPVEFSNVILYAPDSTIQKVETTDETGKFQFYNIENGNYYIQSSFIGFEDLSIPDVIVAGKDLSLGTHTFLSNGIQLDEAVVTAQRSMVEVKADRMVFNVQGTTNSVGDNGLELLRKAPGVLVDNNNNISVLGRSGVIVYVDGKRLPLSGNELTNYLQNLTADQIDRIDIISNPGAKYEAEGNAGIIDIRLKKNENHGSNGTVSATMWQGRKLRGNINTSGNYKNAKVNLFGNVGYNRWNGWNRMNFDNYQNSFILVETNDQNHLNDNFNYRAGMDYYLDDKNTLGILVSGWTGSGGMDAENRSEISMQSTPSLVDSILVATNTSDKNYHNNSFNINYVFRSEETTINIDADYAFFRNEEDFNQPNTYYDATETNILSVVNTATNTPVDIDIATFKIDYEAPLAGGSFGTGIKLSKVMTDNTFFFYDIPNKDRVRNNDRSNRFVYDENVYAGYVNFARQLNQKTSFSAGLRVEQTDAMGDLTAFNPDLNEDPVIFDYVSYFPSVGLSYNYRPEHSFNINVGRRINRPDYNVLNPFRTQLSELSFAKGNAFLRPEIVNNAELGYTLKYRYNFKLSYSRTTDQITRLIGPDEDNPKAGFISWDNLAEQHVYSFNASLPFQVNEWWSAYFNVSGSYIDNQADYGNGAIVDVQAWSYNIFTQNTFTLGKGYRGEISGWYSGPGVWGGVFRYDPSYSLNFGIQKKFMNKLNVKLSFQDVTYQSGWSGYSEFNGLRGEGNGNWDSRGAALSLTYDFGNKKVKSRNRKTGIEDESSRVSSDN